MPQKWGHSRWTNFKSSDFLPHSSTITIAEVGRTNTHRQSRLNGSQRRLCKGHRRQQTWTRGLHLGDMTTMSKTVSSLKQDACLSFIIIINTISYSLWITVLTNIFKNLHFLRHIDSHLLLPCSQKENLNAWQYSMKDRFRIYSLILMLKPWYK